ncbi:MAG: heavy-metal-associated domain-containing protein [Gemmatimonadetes bacterium]|nr:heavy-metal-associated domain-containing protein [Gemmatimonadota bacterium]
MEALNLSIGGMSCGHCVKAVDQALKAVPGVEVQEVKVGGARVQYDPARTTPSAIAGAVTEAGYEAQPA